MAMDLNELTGGGTALPEELMELVQNILEGRVLQFAVACELEGGMITTQIKVFSEDANRFAMVGVLDVMKDDYKMDEFSTWMSPGIEPDEEDDEG